MHEYLGTAVYDGPYVDLLCSHRLSRDRMVD